MNRQRSEFGGEKGKEIEDRKKEVEKKRLKKINVICKYLDKRQSRIFVVWK